MEAYPFIRQIKSPITEEQLQPLDPKCRVVQFDNPLTDEDHEKLSVFLRKYPNVSFRVYSHYSVESIKNLSFLRFYPFVKNFEVDLFKLESLDGIEYLPVNLKYLGIGQTKKKLSLKPLARFREINELYLEGHTKDIDIISELTGLEKLNLRSITLKDLSVLLSLKKLYSLSLKLGGTKDLTLLPQVGNLKYLELWMVKGLSDISVISELPNLQFLFLQDLKNIKSLPNFLNCLSLKRVVLDNMKGLKDLSPLLTAKNLEDIVILSGNNFKPEDISCLKNHSSLKRGLLLLGSLNKNNKVKELLPLELLKKYSDFDFK